MEYKKLNDEPIEIEYVEDEHDEEKDFEASFWFENKRHYLSDYIRTHNNPWIGGEWPEYIHGYEYNVYFKPLYIEIINGEGINVYREKEEEDVINTR